MSDIFLGDAHLNANVQAQSPQTISLEALLVQIQQAKTHHALFIEAAQSEWPAELPGEALAALDVDQTRQRFENHLNACLRALPEARVVHCPFSSAAQLVEACYALVAQHALAPIDQAAPAHAQGIASSAQAPSSNPPLFFVVSQTSAMQAPDWSLLARLAQGFQARGITLLVLSFAAQATAQHLADFGDTLQQWRVTDPLSEAGEPSDMPPVSATSQEPHWLDGAAALGPATGPVLLQDEVRLPEEAQPPSRKWWWAAVLLALTCVGAWYSTDVWLEQAQALKSRLLRGTAATAPDLIATPDSAPAQVPSESASSATPDAAATPALDPASTAVQPASSTSVAGSVGALNPLGASSPVGSAIVLNDTNAPTKVEADSLPAKTQPPKVEPSKPEPHKPVPHKADLGSSVVKPAPVHPKPETTKTPAKVEGQASQAWVGNLPANSYVVQLAALDSLEEAQTFQRSHAAYAQTHILRVHREAVGKRYFTVVAGPFEGQAQAQAYMKSHPLRAKGWLRASRSLKT